jgi:hypothetical protein
MVNNIRIKKKHLAFILILLILYFNTPFHIKHYLWKNNGGGRISDVIKFNNTSYVLRWPFIYKNQEKTGIMVFCFYNRLWIYSYRTGSDYGIGEYVAK